MKQIMKWSNRLFWFGILIIYSGSVIRNYGFFAFFYWTQAVLFLAALIECCVIGNCGGNDEN